MTFSSISTLEETFQPKSFVKAESKRLTLNLGIFVNNLIDLATPKMNAFLAAIETAETLSSVGTVISIK